MSRIAKISFVALVSCILLAPAGKFTYSLLTGKEPKSELEGRERPKLIPATLQTIAGGKVQSAFDAALGFSTPQRDSALLLHAKWQRKLIKLASNAFGFDVYSTYYGSKFAHITPPNGMARIIRIPRKATQRQKSLKKQAQLYAKAMHSYPNVRWFFARADRPYISSAGPFRTLINNPESYNSHLKYLRKYLPKSCTIINLKYNKNEDIERDFFRTDHHWNISGVLRAYTKIARALGIAPIKFGTPAPVTDRDFLGTYVRQGLDTHVTSDSIYDVRYERSKLSVKVNGKPVPESFLNHGYSGKAYRKKSKFEDMYSGYFHASKAEIHITNKSLKRGALLIIGDSYSHSMERFFAESYRDVYKIDPRIKKGTLRKFLQRHAVDDILLFVSAADANEKALAFLH